MAGRSSRASVPMSSSYSGQSSKSRAPRKRKQNGLDAFSLAEQIEPSRIKVRQHRYGEPTDNEPYRKKRRVSEIQNGSRRANVGATEDEDMDPSGGSDSEGHEWRIGEVVEDDDSDIDSDEAFGESDEEKFEGFKFGTSAKRPKATKNAKTRGLNERSESSDASEEGDDELGEDAVDLANVLDNENDTSSQNDPQEINQRQILKHGDIEDNKVSAASDSEEEFSGYSEEDEESSFELSEGESDQEDSYEQHKLLRELVDSLPESKNANGSSSRKDAQPPTLASALAALKESSSLDPAFDKEVKRLSKTIAPAKSNSDQKIVQAPLPKRQQDRIDRRAAYAQAKDTLNRWVDTVKHNRRADHLVFPMQNPNSHEPRGVADFAPTSQENPQNELEKTIQLIMQQSGLGGENGKVDEDQILQAEELQAKNMPVEQVMARTAELRRARELLFREEVRAKRIKKIKSRAYRRVHRKEAQKAAQQERNLLASAGVNLSEDEREANDRRRALERIGAKHRESKWAKGIKKAGRTVWDNDARNDVADMARRNDELRKRIDGEPIYGGGADDSDISSESEDDGSINGGTAPNSSSETHLLGRLDNRNSNNPLGHEESKLGSMRFMQKAEAARKRQNDEAMESLRRDLAGDAQENVKDSTPNISMGRKVFGPNVQANTKSDHKTEKLEFEEPEDSDELLEGDTGSRQGKQQSSTETSENKVQKNSRPGGASSKRLASSLPRVGARMSTAQPIAGADVIPSMKSAEERKMSNATARPSTADSNITTWTTIKYPNDDENGSNQDDFKLARSVSPIIPSNLELVKAAFGGDEVEAAFAAEKASAVSSEDEKILDNALPGWGSWTGEGISKRERKKAQQRTKGRFMAKEEGVKPSDRKDKGLDKVIISEKKSRKNAKYLAPTLPHPFESRQQYESGIRQPLGPDWTTKETFQNATKPRILVKPGRLIEPISAPIL